jgi:F-type H+-transporting ATPase subunit delta
VRDRRLATRYAGALLAAAKQAGSLPGVAEGYVAVRAFAAERPELSTFLEGPQVPELEKKQLLTSVFGGRIEPVLLDFFHLLVDKNRIELLDDIGVELARLYELDQGLRRAIVTTAVALPGDLEPALQARLEKLIGARVVLEKKVDPGVIGGVSVTVGDRILDGTVRSGLERLRALWLRAPLRAAAG